MQLVGGNFAQPVRQSSRRNGSCTVHGIPDGEPKGLLNTAIPLARHDRKQRQATGFEKTEEETGSNHASEVVAQTSQRRSQAPSRNQRGHENPGWDLDNEPRGEGLPSQLCNWGDGSKNGVLIARHAGVFPEAEHGASPEDGLIQYLGNSNQCLETIFWYSP